LTATFIGSGLAVHLQVQAALVFNHSAGVNTQLECGIEFR